MGKDAISAILASHYGGAGLLRYSELDDQVRFRVPAPLRDPQAAAFRSQAPVLNEVAIGHRLSLSVGRDKCGVPQDFSFAIGTLEVSSHDIDAGEGYDVSLSFEVMGRRYGHVTALRSTLVTQGTSKARRTVISFNVIPPSLANFVRRERGFLDFAEVGIDRDVSRLDSVADDHFRYYPSEADRLSDGRRVDHVPALTLIDLALFVDETAHPGAAWSDLSAEFLNYTDPRVAFDILPKRDRSAVEFVQNDQLVAVVRGSQSCEI